VGAIAAPVAIAPTVAQLAFVDGELDEAAELAEASTTGKATTSTRHPASSSRGRPRAFTDRRGRASLTDTRTRGAWIDAPHQAQELGISLSRDD